MNNLSSTDNGLSSDDHGCGNCLWNLVLMLVFGYAISWIIWNIIVFIVHKAGA